jgi:hypothetical protein
VTTDASLYIERAEAARKSRKAAPAVDVRGMVTIPQKDIIRRLAEKEGGVDAQMHRIFVGRDQVGQYADKGYAPVMRDGELVTFQSDVLVEIPPEFHKASLAEAKALSDAMLGERVKSDAKQSRTKVSTGDEVTVQEVSASSLGMAATGTVDSD